MNIKFQLLLMVLVVSCQTGYINAQTDTIDIAGNLKTSTISYTGAISTVSGAELAKMPSSGLNMKLAGKLSGLTLLQSTNEPGSDEGSMYVRGFNTKAGNEPLIVLDGIPNPVVNMNMLNVNTIESISILKDAAAVALYGFRGSNGVILITTKKGFVGKPKVDVTADYSIQQSVNKPKLLHSWEYLTLRNEALTNDGGNKLFSDDVVARFKESAGKNELYPDNNWYDKYVKNFAPMQRYNVNIRGGSQRIRYFVNAGFTDQDYFYKTDKNKKYDPSLYMNRFDLRSNLEVFLTSNLSCFLNSNVEVNRFNAGGAMSTIISTPSYINGPLTPDGQVVGTEFITEPIYAQLNRSGYTRQMLTYLNVDYGMNWNMDFITKGLSIRGLLGYDSRYIGVTRGSCDYAMYIRDYSNMDSLVYQKFGTDVNTALWLSKSSNFYYFMNFQGFIDYSRAFDHKHEVNAFLNYFAENHIDGSLPYDIRGLAGHAQYGYNSRYYLQFDVSYYGSEEFKKFGVFPVVSGAWIASNEQFMKGFDWCSLLKLRASYGRLGNDQISGGRFLYKDNITHGGGGYISSLFGGSLVSEGVMGNPGITWETSDQRNLGLDFELFKAVSAKFDVWKVNQTGLAVQSEDIPSLQGVALGNLAYQNLGKMENKGFEAELVYKKELAKDLFMNLAGNISYNKNKVTDIGELDKTSSNYYYPYRQNGYCVGQEWGYVIDYSNGNGYYNTQEEIDKSGLTYSGTAPRVGDFRYKDLNKDGLIDEKDQAPYGEGAFPQISYGLSTQFNYKSFDLYIQFQGVANATSYFGSAGIQETAASQGIYSDLHKHAWTAERYANGEKILYPALTATKSSSLQGNDFFFSRTDYLRLKCVNLGYSLSEDICRKLSVNKIRFNLSGSNLLTWTALKFRNIDPEMRSWSQYPIYRTFNLGLNLTF